jgi:hypothetical protein
VVRDMHAVVAWVMVVSNAGVGLWVLAAHFVPTLRHRLMWPAVGAAQAVIVVQVLLGVQLHLATDAPAGRHQLYGFAAFISIGMLFAYRNEMRDRPYLLYGLGSLWLMGLGLRAFQLV